MPSSPDRKRLLSVLNKMVMQERWRRMAKVQGVLMKRSKTKSGNIKLLLRGKTEKVLYILQRNGNLFKAAQGLEKGDVISAAARRYLGKYYCTRLGKVQQEKGLGQFHSPKR